MTAPGSGRPGHDHHHDHDHDCGHDHDHQHDHAHEQGNGPVQNADDHHVIPHLEERSFQAREIITRPPRWIVRRGISIIVLVFAFFLASAWFIRFPEVVPSRITITTMDQPVVVRTLVEGRLNQLAVHDHDWVSTGQPLAVLDSSANDEDCRRVMALLEAHAGLVIGEDIKLALGNDPWDVPSWPRDVNLGLAQPAYASFLNALHHWDQSVTDPYELEKEKIVRAHLNQMDRVSRSIDKQREVYEADLELSKKQLDRKRRLLKKGHVSEDDVVAQEAELLRKQALKTEAEVQAEQQRLTRLAAEQEFLDYSRKRRNELNELSREVEETYDVLRARLEEWKRLYLIDAPRAGQVVFLDSWRPGQSLEKSAAFAAILPKDREYVGEVLLDQIGAGRISKGQRVEIRMDGYAYHEFGSLEGRVHSISQITSDRKFRVYLTLPKGTETSLHKHLDIRFGMEGNALFITRELSLLERLLLPLGYVLTR